MAVIYTELFETGADEDEITTSNSIFSTITGTGDRQFTTTDSYEGAKSAFINPVGQNVSMERTHTAKGKTWTTLAFQISGTTPSAIVNFYSTYSAGVLVGALRLTTTRTLQLRDSTTTRFPGTAVLTPGAWYEIHYLCDPASNLTEYKVYDDTGALVEGSGSQLLSVVSTATINEFRVGSISGNVSAFGLYLDRLIVDDTDEPDIYMPSSSYFIYYDTGIDWVPAELYYDNGTSWVLIEPTDSA